MEKKKEEKKYDTIKEKELEEKIGTIKSLNEEFRRIKNPLRIYKRFLRKNRDIVKVKEPVLLFLQGNKVKTYEGVRKGRFKYKHSNGTIKYLNITPQFYRDWDYFGNNIKLIFATEDGAFPFDEDPVIYADEFDKYDTKIRYDTMNYRAAEIRAGALKWKSILIGVAIIVAAILGGMYLLKQLESGNPAPAKAVIQNVPALINQSGTIFG